MLNYNFTQLACVSEIANVVEQDYVCGTFDPETNFHSAYDKFVSEE